MSRFLFDLSLIVVLLVTKVQHLAQPCKFFAKKSRLVHFQHFFIIILADDVVGAILGLVVNAADILADDTKRQQLAASQEQNQNHQ